MPVPTPNDAKDVVAFDLHIRKYRTYQKTFTISGIANATGYSARLMIKADADDTTALITLTSNPASGIVLSSNGSILSIVIAISYSVTGALRIEQGVWDFEITDPSGARKTYAGGAVIVHPSVTYGD